MAPGPLFGQPLSGLVLSTPPPDRHSIWRKRSWWGRNVFVSVTNATRAFMFQWRLYVRKPAVGWYNIINIMVSRVRGTLGGLAHKPITCRSVCKWRCHTKPSSAKRCRRSLWEEARRRAQIRTLSRTSAHWKNSKVVWTKDSNVMGWWVVDNANACSRGLWTGSEDWFIIRQFRVSAEHQTEDSSGAHIQGISVSYNRSSRHSNRISDGEGTTMCSNLGRAQRIDAFRPALSDHSLSEWCCFYLDYARGLLQRCRGMMYLYMYIYPGGKSPTPIGYLVMYTTHIFPYKLYVYDIFIWYAEISLNY